MAEFNTVAEMFEDPKRWTQGVSARDADDNNCSMLAPEAASWCLIGALLRVYNGKDCKQKQIAKVYDAVAIRTGIPRDHVSAVVFNDDPKTSWQDVLAIVKEAGV